MAESQELNPRQLAGKLARQRWKGFTPEGLETLKATALANKPWEASTGPRTVEGKAIVSRNAVKHGLSQPLRALGIQRLDLAKWLDTLDMDAAKLEIKEAIREVRFEAKCPEPSL